jgi:DNA helicase HerA-like ATPase
MGLHLGSIHGSLDPLVIDDVEVELLRRHVAILGATGKGKTVAAKVMLEEAVLAGVPSIVIDPQGDLARLALLGNPETILEKGGDAARFDAFKARCEVRIWTPTKSAGLPICVNPFASDPSEMLLSGDDEEEDILAAFDIMAGGFTSIAGFSGKTNESEVRGFFNELLKLAVEAKSMPTDFNSLADLVLNPVNFLEVWGVAERLPELIPGLITAKTAADLSRKLRALNTGVNKLVFSHGVPVDIDVLRTPMNVGCTPVNVVFMNSIDDGFAQQNFVLEISRAIFSWMKKHRGTSDGSPALVYFIDEAGPFIPPHPANPPAKKTIQLLFKQGRKFGVSCILASQNLKAVDYHVLSQANTRLLGGVTDPRELSNLEPLLPSKEEAERLLHLDTGEFFLVNPRIQARSIHFHTRWLYTDHGDHLSLDDVRALTSDELRAWAERHVAGSTTAFGAPSDSSTEQVHFDGDELEPPSLVDSEEEAETNASELRTGSVATDGADQTSRLNLEHPSIEVNLLGGLSALRSSNDPLHVMLGMTNIITSLCFLIVSVHLLEAWRASSIAVVLPLLSLGMTFLCFGSMLAETMLQNELDILQRLRLQVRPLQFAVLVWAWCLVLLPSVLDSLAYGPIQRASALAAQSLTTVFLLADFGHRLRVRSIEPFEGEGLVESAFNSAKAVLNAPRFEERISSSDMVMRNIRLVVDIAVIYVLLVMLGFLEEQSWLNVTDMGVRILAVVCVVFMTESRVRSRTTWHLEDFDRPS